MKTKLVKFEAPKESTIYNPPLKLTTFEGCSPIYEKLFAFICDRKSQLVFEHGSEIFVFGSYFIEAPDEPQRMTRLQLFQLLNRGGWIVKNADGLASLSFPFHANAIEAVLGDGLKISRIDKIEWIEPTTDLLDL